MATLLTASVRAAGLLRMSEFFSDSARVGAGLAMGTMNERAKVQAYEQFGLHLQNLARGVNRSADDAGLDENLLITVEVLTLVGKASAYEPSPSARRIIAVMKSPVDAPAVLFELLSAEIRDFHQGVIKREAAAWSALADRDDAVAALAKADQNRADAERARQTAETALLETEAKLAEAQSQVAYLRLVNDADVAPAEDVAPAVVNIDPDADRPTEDEVLRLYEPDADGHVPQRFRSDTWPAGVSIEKHNGETYYRLADRTGKRFWGPSLASGATLTDASNARERLNSNKEGN